MSHYLPVALEEVGSARYANLSTAKSLSDAPTAGSTLPTKAYYAMIAVKDQGVHFAFDGNDATTNDILIPAGTVFMLENARTLLTKASMLEASATATVSIQYFDGPRG